MGRGPVRYSVCMRIGTCRNAGATGIVPIKPFLESTPDVVCLQELKCTDAEFPAAAIERAGYRAVWRGQKTWNGVAILSRGSDPVVTRTVLPGDPADTQSRYLEAAIEGVLVGCLYLPNGNPQPGPKFDYKLAWFNGSRLTRESFLKRRCPLFSPATLTLRRPRSIFIRQSPGITTRLCSRQAALPMPSSSGRVGRIVCASFIQRSASTPFGITCGIAGSATPDCGWITCCSGSPVVEPVARAPTVKRRR
jgi:hypothetical protein